MTALELWGGIECTVARIGDRYRDELRETGVWDRDDAIAHAASLGVSRLRFPVLWEHVEQAGGEFAWHDARLEACQAAGVDPIVGLVHHGSGPAHTNLLDPAFAELVADHAGRVARRYPWVTRYTPVNEPLTTARFAALYGHWYPHARDEAAFFRALVNQCHATLLAMRAIRAVTPGAELVQTDDLGKIFAPPQLRYQADYENERRWLSFDLLCGRVRPGHRFHQRFLDAGISEAVLDDLASGEAAPAIVGINHYLTSDRYLDPDLARHDVRAHGGNGRHAYADVEAVRAGVPAAELGFAARLRETWARYRRPVALTEVHNGCTREEQLRWLDDAWRAAETVRREGADVRAVTLWSLFGAVDWTSLLTREDGVYESGVFDMRGPAPRPTALAAAAKELAGDGRMTHPVLQAPGWWRRRGPAPKDARPILITGATGTLGRAIARVAEARGLTHRLVWRADMDIADPAAVGEALDGLRPWAVVNTAGYVRVAEAAREPDVCFRANAHGAATLAEACAARGLPLVTFSSDLVFDGRLGRPYREDDPLSPACVYGRSKAEAERLVQEAHPGALVVRTSAFFGPWDPHNFAHHVLERLAQGGRYAASEAVTVSPTYVPDLAHAALDLLIDGAEGVWHLANAGAMTWHGFAAAVARGAGHCCSRIDAHGGEPAITALDSVRGRLLPPLEDAIERFVRERDPALCVLRGEAVGR